jgi:hypothetical protein
MGEDKLEKKNWFEKILSIDEMKSSSLIISLFASLGFGIFFIFERNDIPTNLTSIIQALIYAIGGVSAVGWAANSYSKGGIPIDESVIANRTDNDGIPPQDRPI